MAKKNQPHTGSKIPPTPKNHPTSAKHTNGFLHKLFVQGLPWTSGILFAVFAWIMLAVMNNDTLYTLQERSLFIDDQSFWHQCMATPAGWVRWLGCYFTQFFHYPALGTSIIIGIWLATYVIILKAFSIKREWSPIALTPLFAMLGGVIGLGYWLYSHKLPGHPFAENIALLMTALACLADKQISTPWKRYVWIVVWTFGAYPLLGWWTLLGTAVMTIRAIVGNKELYSLLIGSASILVAPLLWYYHYSQMRLTDAWVIGFPIFESGEYTSWLMSLPYFIMAFVVIALATIPVIHLQRPALSTLKTAILSLSVFILSAIGCWIINFDDYNYQAEMRMYRQAEKSDWKAVLQEAAKWETIPTRQMVILKNIALTNVRQLGNMAYRYDNRGLLPHTRDSLKVHMALTAAPMLHLNYGKFNYATRWAIENSVEYGWQVAFLKILAKCAILNGEHQLANKYTSLLGKTTFYRDYAEKLQTVNRELQQSGDKKKAASDLGLSAAYELHSHFNNDLDSDNGLCEMYLLHHFSNTMNIDSKLLQEVTLNYAMISKNIQLFWPRFFQYATLHAGEDIPIHYQEAAYLYGTLEPQTVSIKNMPFDKLRIVDRYKRFNETINGHVSRGMTVEQASEACYKQFGDTFWWFYFFCNNVKSY